MLVRDALGALLLICAGFTFGLALDLYRVLCRLSNPGRFLTAVCDLLFWLVYSIWIFVLLQRISAGEVRFHVFLSIAVGFGLYSRFLSRRLSGAWNILIYHAMRTANRVADWLSRVLDVCLAILLWPYRALVNYLLRPLWRVVSFLLTPLVTLANWANRQLTIFGRWLTRPARRQLERLRHALARFLAPPTKDS